MIKGTCSVCGRVFKVDDRYAGQTGRCKSCGATVTVPGEPDEGLDALPGQPQAAVPSAVPAPPSQRTPPPAQAPPQPAAPQESGTEDAGRGTREEDEAEAEAAPSALAARPPSPSAPSPAADERPGSGSRIIEDPGATHDARSRFEPSHGPTAMEGSWLKDEAGLRQSAEQGAGSGRADDVLATKRIVTDVTTVPEARRPAVIAIACVLVGLVGLGFCARFITAWPVGMVPAAIGLLLAGLGIERLWTGHSDGLIPAALFCLCDIGIILLIVFSKTSEGQRVGFTPVALALLVGGAVALLFVIAASLANSSRAYFDSGR